MTDYCSVCNTQTCLKDEQLKIPFCSIGCQYSYYEQEHILIGAKNITTFGNKITYNVEEVLSNIDKNIVFIKGKCTNNTVILNYLNVIADRIGYYILQKKKSIDRDEDDPLISDIFISIDEKSDTYVFHFKVYTFIISNIFFYVQSLMKTKKPNTKIDIRPLNLIILQFLLDNDKNGVILEHVNPYVNHFNGTSFDKIKFYNIGDLPTNVKTFINNNQTTDPLVSNKKYKEYNKYLVGKNRTAEQNKNKANNQIVQEFINLDDAKKSINKLVSASDEILQNFENELRLLKIMNETESVLEKNLKKQKIELQLKKTNSELEKANLKTKLIRLDNIYKLDKSNLEVKKKIESIRTKEENEIEDMINTYKKQIASVEEALKKYGEMREKTKKYLDQEFSDQLLNYRKAIFILKYIMAFGINNPTDYQYLITNNGTIYQNIRTSMQKTRFLLFNSIVRQIEDDDTLAQIGNTLSKNYDIKNEYVS